MRKKYFRAPLEIFEIQEDSYHAFITIKIEGRPVRMLLDTGASRTVFDISTLQQLKEGVKLEMNEDMATGLGSSAVENFIAIIEEIEIAGLKINDYQVGALDLSHVNESYARLDALPIGGVLGSDILLRYKAVISFREEKVVLEKPIV